MTSNKLPEYCIAELPSTGEAIKITRGESGYRPLGMQDVDALNAEIGVTVPQREAMFAGSMFGWHVPAADPRTYNDDGSLNREGLEAVRGES